MADPPGQPRNQPPPQQQQHEEQQSAVRQYVQRHAKVTTVLFDHYLRRRYASAPAPAAPPLPLPLPPLLARLAHRFPLANQTATLLLSTPTPVSHHHHHYRPPTTMPHHPPSPPHHPLAHPYHHPAPYHHHHHRPRAVVRPSLSLHLRRLNPFSLGRFFALSATLLSFFRLSLILSLALSYTLSHIFSPLLFPPDMAPMISKFSQILLSRAVDEHLYHWLVDMLTADDVNVFLTRPVNFMNVQVPSTVYMCAFIAMPVVEGFLFYALGFGIAVAVNIALSFSNGIRLDF